MPIQINNVPRRVVFAASGTGPYAFTFEILAAGDIAVYKDDTLLTITTDYTVTINSNGTGSITLTATPTGATQIAIVGNRTISRTTDFTTGGDFFANTLNDELDQQTIFAQQNAEGLARSLQAPQTDPTTINMTLPRASTRANKTLAFDSSGNPTTGEQIGEWRGNWAAGTVYAKRDLAKDTTNANVYICVVAHTSTGSLPISTNTDVAKWALVVDAAAANTAKVAAEAAQAAAEAAKTAAETAETNAETAETNAETAETNAETAETNAAASAAAAAASASAAATSYDNFDDRYLGQKSSAPTVDNDGNTLLTGAIYFDTSSNKMRVWSGSAWGNVAPEAAVGTQEFTATAGQTSFTVTGGYNTGSVYVYQNGVLLDAADYTATNGTAVVLGVGVTVNDVVRVVTFYNPADTVSIRDAAAASAAAAAASYDSFDDRYLGTKSSDPTVDNDGNTLIDGALYFDTTLNVMKVYDLGNTAWRRTTPTTTEQTNINTVAGISSNVSTVAGISSNVTTVAGVSSNVTTVAGISGNVTTVAGISANVTTVAGVSSNVTTVATNIANVNTNATNISAINTNATNIASIQSASTNATNAANSATAAAASALTAVNAPGTSGTSTSSIATGTGSKSLTTQTSKSWVVGQFVVIARTSAPGTTYMYGNITAYTSGTGAMTVNVTTAVGTGTHTDWTIGLTGPITGVEQGDVGTAPNQIPLNQYLGSLAYKNTELQALDVGTGITTGTGTICKAHGGLQDGVYVVRVLIDLTGLNSGGTANDIIGVNGTALPCYIARLPAMTVLGGRMTCLEAPAGGDTDIDLYSATEGTGVEDAAVTGLTETLIINAGTQSLGTTTYFAADPAANAYLYLAGQSTSNATYTAGRFLIEIFGVQ